MLAEDDDRWNVRFGYTINDDGVWLEYGEQNVCLGFSATLRDALDVIETFTPNN